MATSATVPQVISLLEGEYGIAEWEPRLDPVSELIYTILSQHTSDVNSGRAYRDLMNAFESLDAVAEGDPGAIEKAIRVGGLARIKAPRIKAVLRAIRERCGGLDLSHLREMPLPEAKAWLRQLPGVGPKSAAIVLCFSLGMSAMPVDTHIFRVARRLGLTDAKANYERAHDLLEAAVAPEQVFAFHVYLITHGRRVCKARRPLCGECLLREICPSAFTL